MGNFEVLSHLVEVLSHSVEVMSYSVEVVTFSDWNVERTFGVLSAWRRVGSRKGLDNSEKINICRPCRKQNHNSSVAQCIFMSLYRDAPPISRIYLTTSRCHKCMQLTEHKVLGYFRYVDDIRIIYNEKPKNINGMLSELSTKSPKLQFTSQRGENGKINFLVISIMKSRNSVVNAIYSKPTATDCIIPFDSCRPTQT
jgi:hypothetical protein